MIARYISLHLHVRVMTYYIVLAQRQNTNATSSWWLHCMLLHKISPKNRNT